MIPLVWIYVLAFLAGLGILFAWLINTQPAAPGKHRPHPPKSDEAGTPRADPEPYHKLGPWY